MLRRSASFGGGALAMGGELKKPGVGGPLCDVETPRIPGARALGPGLGGTVGDSAGAAAGGKAGETALFSGGAPPGSGGA